MQYRYCVSCGAAKPKYRMCERCMRAESAGEPGPHRCPGCGRSRYVPGECAQCAQQRVRRNNGPSRIATGWIHEHRRRMGDPVTTPGAEVRRNDQD